MAAESKRPFAHLTLLELLIGVTLLAVAGVFLVRGMQQAKEREQRQQITNALSVWRLTNEEDTREARTKTIFALIKANPKLYDARGFYGTTPLHVAVDSGDNDTTQWLLDHGADVHTKDDGGWTPLHWAAINGRKEIAELLLAKGADINAETNDGKTPLDVAKKRPQQPLIELLLKHGAKE